MKKVIKVTSYGNRPMYVHAAYDRSGNVIRYFLLFYLYGASPIDPEDVKNVMKIAKAEAIDRGFEDVHATTFEYKPKTSARHGARRLGCGAERQWRRKEGMAMEKENTDTKANIAEGKALIRNCDRFVTPEAAMEAFLTEVWGVSVRTLGGAPVHALDEFPVGKWTTVMLVRYSAWLMQTAEKQ